MVSVENGGCTMMDVAADACGDVADATAANDGAHCDVGDDDKVSYGVVDNAKVIEDTAEADEEVVCDAENDEKDEQCTDGPASGSEHISDGVPVDENDVIDDSDESEPVCRWEAVGEGSACDWAIAIYEKLEMDLKARKMRCWYDKYEYLLECTQCKGERGCCKEEADAGDDVTNTALAETQSIAAQ